VDALQRRTPRGIAGKLRTTLVGALRGTKEQRAGNRWLIGPDLNANLGGKRRAQRTPAAIRIRYGGRVQSCFPSQGTQIYFFTVAAAKESKITKAEELAHVFASAAEAGNDNVR